MAVGGQEKKGKIGLIILLAFVGVVGVFVLLTALNAFGLRDNVVMPFLRNVPFVGGFVPEAEPTDETDPSAIYGRTIAELEAQIAALQNEIDELQGDMEDMADEWFEAVVDALESSVELERLREIEESHAQFLADREAFERGVIEGDLEAFERYMETIHPDLIIEIYTNLMEERIAGLDRQHYLDVWAAMSPAAIARFIMARDMATTDMPLLVSVLRDLPPARSATIIDAIPDPNVAGAIVTHKFVP